MIFASAILCTEYQAIIVLDCNSSVKRMFASNKSSLEELLTLFNLSGFSSFAPAVLDNWEIDRVDPSVCY